MTRTRYAALAVVVFALLAFGCEKEPAGLSEDAQISLAMGGKFAGCTTIPSGELETSTGELIVPGYDGWGYNYQAHLFNGAYCDYHPYYRPGGAGHEWCQANYGDVELVMKWNDEWLSNKDCSGDGKLDRPSDDGGTYIGSGAWETNQMVGEYEMDGQVCSFTYFVKIIAVPGDATLVEGVWYNADGTEIGEAIWGSFAIIQQVSNDPCLGEYGLLYGSPDHPGFGGW